MKGWKTWLAALGSVLWGIGGWLADLHGPDVAIGFVTGGLAMVGLGHKIEKQAAETKASRTETQSGKASMLCLLVLACVACGACSWFMSDAAKERTAVVESGSEWAELASEVLDLKEQLPEQTEELDAIRDKALACHEDWEAYSEWTSLWSEAAENGTDTAIIATYQAQAELHREAYEACQDNATAALAAFKQVNGLE